MPPDVDAPASVRVGPFEVADATRAAAVEHVVSLGVPRPERTVLVYSLHVGGLNARRDAAFVAAMADGDVVLADGGSAVALARLAGATSIERSPTTDVVWDVVHGLAERAGRPVRVALVGGPEGLAARTGEVLGGDAAVEVVAVEHGYHEAWSPVLARLRDSAPDATFVGLGAPREMVWCHTHRDGLPDGLVLTCGGLFGHLTGEERRAPRLLRRSGVEWVARLAQAPGRLGPRYARGLVSSVLMAAGILARRLVRR